MSDETATEQEGVEEQEGAEQPEQTPDAEADDQVGALRREAARYRTRLREAEQQRDQSTARLADMQRAEVERTVTTGPRPLANGADLWTGGVSLEELLDDNGALDSAKLEAARERVLSEHPNWRAPTTGFDGGVRGPAPSALSFGEALKDVRAGLR